MGAVKVPNSLSGVTIGSNNPQGVPAPSYFSTGSYTTTLPSTPPNGPQGVNSQGPSPSYITSPQPVTLFPYYYSGIYVPFDPSAQPVNYSVNRSQDPNGSDLPLQGKTF